MKIPYYRTLFRKIEPVTYTPCFAVISGFIQWNRSACCHDVRFMSFCAGVRASDRIICMIPGDVFTPQGSNDLFVGAYACYRSSYLVQNPVFEGITSYILNLSR